MARVQTKINVAGLKVGDVVVDTKQGADSPKMKIVLIDQWGVHCVWHAKMDEGQTKMICESTLPASQLEKA